MSTDPRDIVDVLRSRADVVANRRRALLSEAADEIVRLRAAAAALHELVELKALKDSIEEAMFANWVGKVHTPESSRRRDEYGRRKPAAWAAARAADAALKEPSHD